MTDEYQRGFADAKDVIGKMIAGGLSGLCGIGLIADVSGDKDGAKAAEAVTKAMSVILDEIDQIQVPSPAPAID